MQTLLPDSAERWKILKVNRKSKAGGVGLVGQLLLPGGVGGQGLEVRKAWPEVSLWTLPGGGGVLLAVGSGRMRGLAHLRSSVLLRRQKKGNVQQLLLQDRWHNVLIIYVRPYEVNHMRTFTHSPEMTFCATNF